MPVATIVIVTFNRKDDLRQALHSALRQRGDLEILVIDDVSTDGTDEMMRAEFPTVRYVRAEKNVGSIVHRNRAAGLAKGEIIISMDDDAEFSTPDVVGQTLRDFDDPRIAAVAIPYIDVKVDPEPRQAAPDKEGRWLIASFRGTAFALRRDVFIETGLMRGEFRQQGEETDLCLRMLDRGYVVRRGRSDPILHNESPKRIRSRQLWYSTRNWCAIVLLNYPLPDMIVHLAAKNVNALRRGLKNRMIGAAVQGILAGYWFGLQHVGKRKPVRRSTLKLYEKIRRRGPIRLEDVPELSR
jgi:GT2 family glycosyltransferase